MTTPQAVKKIVDAGNGHLVGRTRLQKSTYLLEALGLGFGFEFNYHYYGPYSEELSIAADDAAALGLVRFNWQSTQEGNPFAVYESNPNDSAEESEISRNRQSVMRVLGRFDSVTLELAATALFLAQSGHADDPWAETRRRKSMKATNVRVEKAQKLLNEIGLQL